MYRKTKKGEDSGDFQDNDNFQQMPFSGFGSAIGMLSWIPFLFSAVLIFILASIAQLAYNIITQPDAPITYGAIFNIFLISLASAFILGFLVKLLVERKMKSRVKIIRF